MKVEEIMTKDPITVKGSDTLGSVVKLLAEHRISGLPVVSRSRLVGVITQTDVIRAIDVHEKVNKGNDSFSVIAALLQSDDARVKSGVSRLLRKKVGNVKSGKVVSVDVCDDLYKSATLINMHGIDRLPVTKNGRLVGIITKSDIIMALGKWQAD